MIIETTKGLNLTGWLQLTAKKGVTQMLRTGSIALACVMLLGCGPTPKVTRPTSVGSHKLMVFFDGTSNDFDSETDISKLRNRLVDAPDDSIGTFYVEGVGASKKPIGMATGWGLGYRVQQAYAYLIQNYHRGDEIYFFGFSRGALSARFLASLVDYGGLPSTPLKSSAESEKAAESIYRAYRGNMPHDQRVTSVQKALRSLPDGGDFKPTNIELLGLWDTVGAMGLPDYREDVVDNNSEFEDQLCNVKHAMHALALDDNRATAFTPLLLTRSYLLKNCSRALDGSTWDASQENITRRLNEVVDEVWFIGAHADVGGGYADGYLNGISMNWFLSALKRKGLLLKGEYQRADFKDPVHDPAKFMNGTIYREQWRDLRRYATESSYNEGRLKIDSTVVARIETLPTASDVKVGLRGSARGLPELFPECFEAAGEHRYTYRPHAGCLLEESL